MKHNLVFVFTFLFLSAGSFHSAWSNYISDSNLSVFDPVVVSANRVEMNLDRVADDIDVYTSDDIAGMPAQTLSDVLKYIPGVDVDARSGLGQATSVNIRGSKSRHVLVMVDGIPFNTQVSGQANLAKIPVGLIDRIEVVKGAASSTWGSSLGGVINVITKSPTQGKVFSGSLTSSYAEFATTHNTLDVSGQKDEFGYYLYASHLNTEGIVPGQDVTRDEYFAKIQQQIGDQGLLEASFGYTGADVKDRTRRTPNYTRYGKVGMNIDTDRTYWSADFKFNDQDIINDHNNSHFFNDYFGVSLVGRVDLREEDVLAFGFDADWHRIQSTAFLAKSERIAMQAPFVNYTYRLGPLDIIPGLRYDNNERFGAQTSPSLGMIYHFDSDNNTYLRAKVARSFNAPHLLLLFNDDPSQLVGPNPDLKAEKSNVYELGFHTEPAPGFDFDINWYLANVNNAIGLVFNGAVFTAQNFDEFRRTGGDVSFSYRMSDTSKIYASAAYNYVEDQEEGEEVRNNGTAKQSYRLGWSYVTPGGFGVDLHGFYDFWDAEFTSSRQPEDQKFIFNLKLAQRLKQWSDAYDVSLFLNVYNLTNSKYWQDVDFPSPLRYFEGGVKINF